jgi:hypothetical protein
MRGFRKGERSKVKGVSIGHHRIRHSLAGIAILTLLGTSSCKKTIIQNPVYDNIIYNVDTVYVYGSNVEKTKQKTSTQYLSILFADVFQQTIPSRTLTDLDELNLALGDKVLANGLVINGFVNSGSAIIPTDAEMRADVDAFAEDTYRRFYLRKPTAYEKHYMVELINGDPGLTPKLLYSSFAESNEYLFY